MHKVRRSTHGEVDEKLSWGLGGCGVPVSRERRHAAGNDVTFRELLYLTACSCPGLDPTYKIKVSLLKNLLWFSPSVGF